MDSVASKALVENWKRKLIAIVGAIAIWLFVHQSITTSRTISGVPVRIVNLPHDKTVAELLPNGILNRRVTLTLNGTKDVVDRLEPSDLEVIVDATGRPDEWILQISKKNLYSLNPELDLMHHIRSVSSSEFLVKFSRLITEQIPVTIAPPKGSAPGGYEFLDIWPQNLMHTVTGPEEQVRQLKQQGYRLTFDLNQITSNQLNQLKSTETTFRDDEVRFYVPDRWKSVVVPFESDIPEVINDPKAEELHITFLRKQLKPIEGNLPVRVFYPVDNIETVNPNTYALSGSGRTLQSIEGMKLLSFPIWAGEVSQAFLDLVRENLEIVIIAAPAEEREFLDWSIEFINQRELEDRFVNLLMAEEREAVDLQKKEARLRRRFRRYMQNLALFKENGQRLLLQCRLDNGSIIVNDVSAVL